jgi:hypothetical protein
VSAVDVMVVVGGVAAIAWVNWYFLLAGRGKIDERRNDDL